MIAPVPIKALNFRDYYYLAFLSPARCFSVLLLDTRKLKLAAYAVSLSAFLYTLVYPFLVIGKGMPYKPWLNIPPESYYRYNVWFLAPSMFLAWVLSAAIVHVTSLAFNIRGNFENTLATYGFSLSVASWSTLVHDLITSFLGAVKIMDQRQYEFLLNSPTPWRALLLTLLGLYVIWYVFMFTKAARSVYRTKFTVAFFQGLLGFIIYQGFFFIFNR